MLLKPFLLVMGANGIITLDQHGGGWKIFYIINCIVLYIYALPFFIIKFIKLKKALQAAVTVDDTGISLSVKGKQLAGIAFADAQSVMVESEPLGLCVSGPGGSVCLGSRKSRISGFYIPGLEQIVEIVRAKAGRVEQVSGLKGSLKGRGIKPLL
jgi:hypothetical protein